MRRVSLGSTLVRLCRGGGFLERAWLQSPDRGGVHVVGSRHVRLGLASDKPRQGFLPLVGRELARPTAPYRTGA